MTLKGRGKNTSVKTFNWNLRDDCFVVINLLPNGQITVALESVLLRTCSETIELAVRPFVLDICQ